MNKIKIVSIRPYLDCDKGVVLNNSFKQYQYRDSNGNYLYDGKKRLPKLNNDSDIKDTMRHGENIEMYSISAPVKAMYNQAFQVFAHRIVDDIESLGFKLRNERNKNHPDTEKITLLEIALNNAIYYLDEFNKTARKFLHKYH